jgi:acyl-coenzyme A synthetase/AMP-(fatty) acid ligase
MTYALKIAKSKILITLPSSLEVALAAARNAGIPHERVFLLEGQSEGHPSIQGLMERGSRYAPDPPYRIPRGKTNKEICGYLNFSSGTTGLPKAVSDSRTWTWIQTQQQEQWMMMRSIKNLLTPSRSCFRTTMSSGSVISSGQSRRRGVIRFWR